MSAFPASAFNQSPAVLPARLTRIDETIRHEHRFLDENDHCFFFIDYFPGTGYGGGDTNQLIVDFKCKPSIAATNCRRDYWKDKAIQSVAAGLRKLFLPSSIECTTWVPIPSSKAFGHPDYDDRLHRTLNIAFRDCNADIRQLLRQMISTDADHTTDDRLPLEHLSSIIEIQQDELSAHPVRRRIVLFDDVLTTGKHFTCCKRRLREAIPKGMPILGLFIARRILCSPLKHRDHFASQASPCISAHFRRVNAFPKHSPLTTVSSRNSESARSTVVTTPTSMNVFTVGEFESPEGKKRQIWTKIGIAFPHRDGIGFNIELRAFPRDARLVVLPRKDEKPDADANPSTSDPLSE